jgi:cysteinyl-tRNA synthetase
MALHIYDSLAGEKRPFVPNKAGEVSLYVCGMTVYDYCHIGHARSLLAFDMIARYLRFSDYNVNFVRNITDIDDKIIRRAQELGEDWLALVDRFIAAMKEDEQALGIVSPDHEPRATQHIEQMQAIIQTLIDRDMAYVSEQGDVCFAVEKFDEYGKLSGRNIDQLQAGARIQDSRGKRNPLDFVLWKPVKPGEPAWDSPWGSGRPGWHIECSAMSKSLLGLPFDIHGGGMDLKFPHHENEIAQSEAADCCGFANYWVHSGLLNVDGEKMSKSLGNFLTIRDALQTYSAEQIRFFMFNSHYGSPVNFCKAQMDQSQASLIRLYTALRGLPEKSQDLASNLARPYHEQFCQAMDDDFNTPIAFSVLFQLAKEINKARDQGEQGLAARLGSVLKQLGAVMGVLQQCPEAFLQGSTADAEKIEQLIAERLEARSAKDWARADQIRDELQAMQVVLEDADGTTTWRFGK